MLLRATLRFLPAQLLAPLAQLASVVAWTRWLAPAEMGVFTLVTVAQEIAYIVCLGWFSVYALRYLPACGDHAARERYLGTENVIALGSILGSLVVAVVVVTTLPNDGSIWLRSFLVGLFFSSRAFNVHYAERARAQQAFVAYSLLQSVGPVGGLALGLLSFHFLPASAWVLLGAYAAAQMIGTMLALPLLGIHPRLTWPDTALLRAAIAFGFPILGLGMLGWVAENYIRYLVQWQAGGAALGMMIVGWQLGRRCAGVASMLVATAAFPLAARLLNEGRRDAALTQLSLNAALMLAVLVPVTAALALLAPTLVALTIAPVYRDSTLDLFGLAVLGGAVRNLHAHVTDQLMVLDRQIHMAAKVDFIEIAACAVASFIGIFFFGMRGAVVGQAIGSLLTLAISAHWAHRYLGFVWPRVETAKVAMATAVMALALGWLETPRTLTGLVTGTILGSAVYVGSMALLFAPQCRNMIAAWRA